MTRIRTLLVGVVAMSLLVLASPVAADTETDELFVAESSAEGVTLTVMGSPVLEVSSTAAAATMGEAAATAVPAAIGGSPVGERSAVSEGELVGDPADPDEACQIAVPAPLSSVVGIGLLCGQAEATGDVPEAFAEASAGEVAVLQLDEDALAPLIGLLDSLGVEGLLDELTQALGDDLVADVFDGLREGCEEVLQQLEDADPGLLDGLLGPIGGVLDQLSEASPDTVAQLLAQLSAALDDLPSTCDALSDLLDLGGDGLPDLIDLGSLTDALAGTQPLLGMTLLGTSSEAGADDLEVGASAGGSSADAGVGLTLSLAGLGDALEALVGGTLGDLLDTLDGIVAGTPLADDLPVLGDLVGQVLGESALLDTLLGEDLLAASVTPGDAAVVVDRDSGEFDADTSAAIVELGGPLMAVSDALNDLVGTVDAALLSELAASPLGDLVEVSLLSESVEDAEVGGLPGLMATSGAASVTLLGAVDGGVSVDVSTASAAVGYDTVDQVAPAGPDPEPVEDEEDVPTLPVTGGGGLLLGLLALGGVFGLRRRD